MKKTWKRLVEIAQEETGTVLEELPEPLREQTRDLLITYEQHPDRRSVSEGIEPDTMGLFVGRTYAEENTSLDPVPPSILLFLDNIWDEAEHDEDLYRDEVRTTVLHELGHFLGLEESDLDERGLE